MCAYWEEIDCRTGSPGFDPSKVGDTKDVFGDVNYWYDACEGKWVETPGEGVFMVMGVLPQFRQPPRGINLTSFTKSADLFPASWYQLRDP